VGFAPRHPLGLCPRTPLGDGSPSDPLTWVLENCNFRSLKSPWILSFHFAMNSKCIVLLMKILCILLCNAVDWSLLQLFVQCLSVYFCAKKSNKNKLRPVRTALAYTFLLFQSYTRCVLYFGTNHEGVMHCNWEVTLGLVCHTPHIQFLSVLFFNRNEFLNNIV